MNNGLTKLILAETARGTKLSIHANLILDMTKASAALQNIVGTNKMNIFWKTKRKKIEFSFSCHHIIYKT